MTPRERHAEAGRRFKIARARMHEAEMRGDTYAAAVYATDGQEAFEMACAVFEEWMAGLMK